MTEQKSQTFHVEGMTCASCVFFIEETLPGNAGVQTTRVDLRTCTAIVSGDFVDDPVTLAQKLTGLVEGHGYRLLLEKVETKKSHREFFIAVPAALSFIAAFLLLQQFGLVHLVGSGNVSLGTAALVGLIASVSTCLAVVGGLVLSLSAHAAKNQGKWQSQALFHLGRLGGFFILGGVIGMLGKVFQLGIMGTGILGLVVAAVMFILGLNLLDIFPGIARLTPKMPKTFAKYTSRVSASSHMLAPLLVGVATFFLPCGFTQSMQVYTLTTGSFLTGALTMFFFALGTFPVLAALSFGALEIAHKPWKGTFFKASGIIIIVLALFNAWNALIVLGVV
ncbi:MAG: sulfite exporter TauE/SafE family protein [Patescibacteria group bacterium]